MPSLLLILNKKIKDIYREIEGRIGKGREKDGNVNNTPSEPSFPEASDRRKEMTIEALKKLREFSRAESCEERAEAVGLRCHESASCAECLKATGEAAGALLDEVEKRLVPEGMEWPRFSDGEPVRIGDEVLGKHGEPMAVTRVCFVEGGCYFNESHRKDGRRRGRGWRYVAGERVKRPKPADTQERIDEDAMKSPCEYFGRKGRPCFDGDGCPSLEMDGSCGAAKTRDLLRRQRELYAKGAGRC